LLQEYFITDEDEKVRTTDRPERLQKRMPGRGEIGDAERKDEAEWILPQLVFDREPDNPDLVRAAVEKVLSYFQNDRMEVPFVAHHRRDYFEPYLQRRHLWQVFELDERWERLQSRRLRLDSMSRAVSKRLRGDADDVDENDAMMLDDAAVERQYGSETEGQAEDRRGKEAWAAESRADRLQRAEAAAAAAQAAAEAASTARVRGPEEVNVGAAAAHAEALEAWRVRRAKHDREAAALEARRREAEELAGSGMADSDDEEELAEEGRRRAAERAAVAAALAALG
ncbi:unnamed protein product, partial [Phaeothamnion confervicola]